MRKAFRDIRKLDWKNYPLEDIGRLLYEFGKFPMMVTDYDEGRIIHRARPINDNVIVSNVSELSYKPQVANLTHQRASTPSMTMFYGAVIPENMDSAGINNGRITSAMETCSFLRNTKLDGAQRLLYGKWKVKSRISLITVLFTRFRRSNNQWIKTLSEEFYNHISTLPYEQQKKSKQINNFLSDEFSKFVGENEDYKYLISSTFAQKCAQNGFDSVLYPSVRTMGLGLNVAIKSSSVDEKMELISVLDCKVFKRQKQVIINNLAFCNVSEGNENFELIEITDPDLKFSDDEIEVGLNQ